MDNQKGLVEVISEKVWKFLSSVKLAVILLIILAIVSVIGTVIEQNQSAEKYLMEYTRATVDLFEMLGLFDLYHTWWFVLLLFLLTANLTVCTLDRFPRTWSIIKAPLKTIDDAGLKAVPFKKEITFKGGIDKAEARASQVLQSRRYRYLLSSGPGAVQLYTQKGAYSRLGVYLTHTSVILIFLGALLGAFFGFKAFLNLPEGEASNVVYLRNEPMWDRIMDAIGVSKSRAIRDPRGGASAMPLGFFVRCDDFEVDYYQGASGPTGMASEYSSFLRVFDLQGREIRRKRIEVNDPLKHRGITFYQSSYGTLPGARGKVVLSIRQKQARSMPEQVVIDPGSETYVPSIDRTIKVLGVAPFGMRNPTTGQVMYYQARNNEFINPTVELEVYKGQNSKELLYRTQIMKVDQGIPHMPEEYRIGYEDFWGARYTGLQVTKDPGVWIVYTGFILLCIGPLIAFFGSHKKLWVWIQDRKGQAVMTVAGSANRNRLGFEREFNRIVEDISR